MPFGGASLVASRIPGISLEVVPASESNNHNSGNNGWVFETLPWVLILPLPRPQTSYNHIPPKSHPDRPLSQVAYSAAQPIPLPSLYQSSLDPRCLLLRAPF